MLRVKKFFMKGALLKIKIKYLVPVFILILIVLGFLFYKYYNNMSDLEKLEWLNKQVSPWGQDLMGVDNEIKKEKIKVAILDSGINDNHEDLDGKVVKKYNTLNNSNKTRDDFNHGTAIAGIITANDNDKGVIGLDQNIEIYDVKVLDQEGHGSIEQLVKGIKWSITQNVDIINLSLGFQSDSTDLREVIKEAVSSGIIVIAAAGNTFNLGMDYPAQYDDVISVNAIDSELGLIDAAALGKTDFVAPGEEILSTNADGKYSLYSGTSFAAAYVTGALSNWLREFRNSEQNEGNINKHVLLDFIESRKGIIPIKSNNQQKIIKIN